jgi:exopolyphosphatase/guanosine-5'-triphosphate,3'-diphosphate pyrophosphatase
MIIADEQLPLTVMDRGIVGIIAGAHRGKVQPRSQGIFSLLTPGQQQDILALSAILRIADGLDFLHRDSVKSLTCTITDREIVITLDSDTGAGAEIERAYQKADLFRQIFSRELVIG